MKLLRHLMISSLILFLTGSLFAQKEKPTKITKEKTAYPITTEYDPEMAVFNSIFEEADIGNLAIFSALQEKLPMDYFYTGTEVDPVFYALFDEKMEEKLEQEKIKLYAVYQIKGNAGQRFILRLPTERGAHTIALFELVDGKLTQVDVLAYADCGPVYCNQQDAWLTDLDGDTDLDILIKRRQWINGGDDYIKKGTDILLQDDAGIFREADYRQLSVNLDSYQMEELRESPDMDN